MRHGGVECRGNRSRHRSCWRRVKKGGREASVGRKRGIGEPCTREELVEVMVVLLKLRRLSASVQQERNSIKCRISAAKSERKAVQRLYKQVSGKSVTQL